MKQLVDDTRVIWNANEYHELSIAQQEAASRFIKILSLRDTDSILDVGCGDGGISAQLAEHIKRGKVLGIDSSPEMIQFARASYLHRNKANFSFVLRKAEDIEDVNKYDVVFSSFALQWIGDKNRFFKKAYTALKNKGRIGLVIPLGISPELEQVTGELIHSEKWKDSFVDFCPGWHFMEDKELENLIMDNCFDITYVSTELQTVRFSAVKALKKYILLWYSYLEPLSTTDKEVFFSEVIKRYLKLLPPREDGSVVMNIPRIDLIASKVSS